MSDRATCWVLGHSETEGVRRLILLVLANSSDVDGNGIIRPKTIADQCRLPHDNEAISKALRRLDADGVIELGEVRRRTPPNKSGLTYRYRIPVPPDYHPELRYQAKALSMD